MCVSIFLLIIMLRQGITGPSEVMKVESPEPLKKAGSLENPIRPISETNAHVAVSKDVPRTEEIEELSFLSNTRNQRTTKKCIFTILYPLHNREQVVSKEVFKRVEGKFFSIGVKKFKIVYPKGYPVEKRTSYTQVRNKYLEFEAQASVFKDLKNIFEKIAQMISFTTNVANQLQELSHWTTFFTKSVLMRVSSIFVRFLNIITKDNVDIINLLCLITDAVALKTEVDEFRAEGLEDIVFSSVVNMLPQSLKAFALALLTINKKDAILSSSFLQNLTDLLISFLDYLSSIKQLSATKPFVDSLKKNIAYLSSYSLVSQCTSLVLRYRATPSVLSLSSFWSEIDALYAKIDPNTAGLAGTSLWDVSRAHTALKIRVDAFLSLKKLKDQLQHSSRVEPSCFIFDGPPGLLKSVTLTKLLPLLGKTVYVHHVKNIKDGKDFYDMYDNQEVFYMDDVGQQGRSQWRNLINWVSCVPLPLDCAEAKLKNTKLFNSEIILLTTNQFMNLHGFTESDGISDPEALFRRAFVFDWSHLRLRNKDSGVGLIGEVSVKKYNLGTRQWDVFNLQRLEGTHRVNSEDDLLAWLASWILSVSAWKKKCRDNNQLSEERAKIIKDKIVISSFESEAGAIGYGEVVDNDEREEFEDCTEDIGELSESQFTHEVILGREAINYDLPMSMENIELFSDVDSITLLGGKWQNGRGTQTASVISKRYLNVEGELGLAFVSAVIAEWSLLDHLKVFLSKIKQSIDEVIGFLIRSLVSLASNKPVMTVIIWIVVYLLFLLIVNKVTSGFFGESESSVATNWESIKPLIDTAVSSQISSIERSHIKKVLVGERKVSVCCFCFDRYILIPSHSVFNTNKYQELTVIDPRTNTVLLESLSCEIIFKDDSEDIVVCKLPAQHPLTFKNVNFSSESVQASHLVTPVGSIKTQRIAASSNLGAIPYHMKGNKIFSNVIKPNERELYTVHFSGLCGSVLVGTNGTPIGMHVAGSDASGLGVSILWTSKLRTFLQNLRRASQSNSIVLHDSQDDDRSCARVESIGFAAVPARTSIVPSPLYGIYPVDREPADLLKYGENTVRTVFHKSTTKIVDPPTEQLEFGESVIRELLPTFTDVTDFQVIKGYPGVAGMNKKSSNGFNCRPLKEDYIDFEIGEPLPFFKDELNLLEKQVKEEDPAQWEKFVWFETLKDEIRNEEKEREPRSFRVSTIHQQFWTKKLTADLVEKTLKERRNNQIMIGCNPIVEWPVMASVLSTLNIFAGDIGKWDGAMLPSVQKRVNKVIMEKYKGDHREMLCAVLGNLQNSIVLVKGRMYVMTHSMPSGSFLTAFYNSLVNRFYTAMWYAKNTPNPNVGLFNREVVDYVYGDDKVVGVTKNRLDLNAISMLHFFQSIGMHFTDANKLPISVEYQTLDQISFLKRDFTYHNELQKIVCPLSLRTLKNTISWVDSRKELDDVLEGKIDAIYRELYLHNDRENLMREFKMLVEAIYEERKWLSNQCIKQLYEKETVDFFLDNNKYLIYS